MADKTQQRRREPLGDSNISSTNIIQRRLRERGKGAPPPPLNTDAAPPSKPTATLPPTGGQTTITQTTTSPVPRTMGQRVADVVQWCAANWLLMAATAAVVVAIVFCHAPVWKWISAPRAPGHHNTTSTMQQDKHKHAHAGDCDTTIVTGFCATPIGSSAVSEQFCEQTLKCKVMPMPNTVRTIWKSIGTEKSVSVVRDGDGEPTAATATASSAIATATADRS
ncbi:hypothetical protein CLAFUW4_14837 [Fulvia fulva]|nr:hypothetical protein CLAFUR0_14830 [Fulvia fulva]WPV23021.1 hypothetical protein CLAFUW4_14837 [Fulvia fulva]WPV37970.1 hypothetical protein CLAFUW7_14838 [Fulvia fulva]